MIPSTRAELKTWILRKLGQPVIEVNVAPEQMDDRIDEALYKFFEKNSNALEEGYIIHEITDEDVSNGYIQLDPSIAGVSDFMKPVSGFSYTSIEYQWRMTEIYSMSTLFQFGDLSYYWLTKQHMSLLNYLFNPEYTFSYNSLTNRLTANGLASLKREYGIVILKVYRKISTVETMDSAGDFVGNIWKDMWLQNFALELVRQQWAQNLSKYKNVQLLNGVMIDPSEMMSEARENIQKLLEQLDDEYSFPPDIFVA